MTAFGGFRPDEQRRKSRMTSAEGFCWVSKTRPQRSPSIALNSTPALEWTAFCLTFLHHFTHSHSLQARMVLPILMWAWGGSIYCFPFCHFSNGGSNCTTECLGLWRANEWMGQFAWWRDTHKHKLDNDTDYVPVPIIDYSVWSMQEYIPYTAMSRSQWLWETDFVIKATVESVHIFKSHSFVYIVFDISFKDKYRFLLGLLKRQWQSWGKIFFKKSKWRGSYILQYKVHWIIINKIFT